MCIVSNMSSATDIVGSNNNIIISLPAPIADSRDGQHLSAQQCFLREKCIEYFEASALDVGRGRQTTVTEGRVGVRCAFCKDLSREERASQASKYIFVITDLSTYDVIVIFILCAHISCLVYPFILSLIISSPQPHSQTKLHPSTHLWLWYNVVIFPTVTLSPRL